MAHRIACSTFPWVVSDRSKHQHNRSGMLHDARDRALGCFEADSKGIGPFRKPIADFYTSLTHWDRVIVISFLIQQ